MLRESEYQIFPYRDLDLAAEIDDDVLIAVTVLNRRVGSKIDDGLIPERLHERVKRLAAIEDDIPYQIRDEFKTALSIYLHACGKKADVSQEAMEVCRLAAIISSAVNKLYFIRKAMLDAEAKKALEAREKFDQG